MLEMELGRSPGGGPPLVVVEKNGSLVQVCLLGQGTFSYSTAAISGQKM